MFSALPIFPDELVLGGLVLVVIAVAMAWKGSKRLL